MHKGFYDVLFLLLFSLLIISCDSSRVYENNKNLTDRSWNKDSVASFSFTIVDIHKQYNFYFNLRNTLTYPYQNIYLNYSLEDTLGNVFDSDLTNMQLFDSKTGKPIGNGLGDVFDHQYKVIENYVFNNPGVYVFNIKQFMRRDELPEIISVGIRLEFSEN